MESTKFFVHVAQPASSRKGGRWYLNLKGSCGHIPFSQQYAFQDRSTVARYREAIVRIRSLLAVLSPEDKHIVDSDVIANAVASLQLAAIQAASILRPRDQSFLMDRFLAHRGDITEEQRSLLIEEMTNSRNAISRTLKNLHQGNLAPNMIKETQR